MVLLRTLGRVSIFDGFTSASWTMLLVVVMAPAAFLLTPFLPGSSQTAVIAVRMLLLPVLFAILLPRAVDGRAILFFIAFSLMVSLDGLQRDLRYSLLILISMIGAIIYFRAGVFLSCNGTPKIFWKTLLIGGTIVNLVTIGVLIGVVSNTLDLYFVYELFGRESDVALGVFRFSLGNAIMTPFVVTSLLYAAMRNLSSTNAYPIPAALNLMVAFISESRLVFLIALLVFISQISRASFLSKIISFAAIAAVVSALWDFVQPVLDSLWDRLTFGSRDHGSAQDRAGLLGLVVESLTPAQIIFGHGVTSAARLVEAAIGEYRTVESVPLQVVCEVGLVGFGAWLLSMVRRLPLPDKVTVRFDPILFLIIVQMFFFLPIHDLMPLTFFSLGALVFSASRRVQRGSLDK